MEENILENLNSEQKNALLQTEGAVLVTAGAGSGKTRLLTHRIAYLIKEKNVMPENILAITFTNKASNEMQMRVQNMLEMGQNVWISTFHSMCVKILRKNIQRFNSHFDSNFSIYADNETEKVLKKIIANKNITDDKILKSVLFHLSNMKNNNVSLERYIQENSYDSNIKDIKNIIVEYQNELASSNALDFDDLLVFTYNLFVACPEILEYYSARFKYILVDEFQDTNVVQYDIVKLLCGVHKNIFVVGDEDQCIYTWRGANFKNISKFINDFENVKVFKLEQNYRSTKIIIDCANKLIKNNKSRIDKTLWTEKEGEYPIERKEFYDEQEEADFIARTIIGLVNKGYKYSDFAILLRLNALSFPFEEKLLAYNIPHKIYGGFKFYERVEVKNVLAYLKLFVNIKDNQAFLRAINFPKRGIGDGAIQKIDEIARIYNISYLEVCLDAENLGLNNAIRNKIIGFVGIYKALLNELQSLTLDDFAQKVVDDFNIKGAFTGNSEDDMDKILNIEQLISSIKNYVYKNGEDSKLNDYLESVSLTADIDTLDNSDNVIVATVHSVKGLEFTSVFLPALEEKIFPISRAYDDNKQMEEERRLMYVAITRAKERLFLSNCQTRYLWGRRDYMIQSRFLDEIGYDSKHKEKYVANNQTTRKTASEIDFIKGSIKSATTFSSYMQSTTAKKNTNEFKEGQVVLHTRFGIGTILSIDEECQTADIDFGSYGVKTLMLDVAPIKIVK